MQTIEAIYENGVFKPSNLPTDLVRENEKVELVIGKKISPEQMLELAAQVYEGLSDEEINEIEKIALNR